MTASSDDLVRFRPAGRPSEAMILGSSRLSSRRFCALASKPPGGRADLVQRRFAVVAERRMADVVRESGQIDQVGVAAELLADLPGDLRDLQRVRQPGARHRVLVRRHHLGLPGQPAERPGVQHPGPVAGEGIAAACAGRFGQTGRLRRLRNHPVGVSVGVTGGRSGAGHGHTTVDPAPEEPPVSR